LSGVRVGSDALVWAGDEHLIFRSVASDACRNGL